MEIIYNLATHLLNGVLFIVGCKLAIKAFDFRVPIAIFVMMQEGEKGVKKDESD